MAAKPDLLFLSPVLPDPDGIGLAQRGALFVRALARRYRVSLHVIPVFGSVSRTGGVPLRELYADVVVEVLAEHEDPLFRMISKIGNPLHRLGALIAYPRPTPCRFATERLVADIASRYRGIGAVHVFRLYLAPYVTPFLERAAANRPTCWLDLDDDESLAHGSLASLAERRGLINDAKFERAEVGKYDLLERALLSRFANVFVAGADACAGLARRHAKGRFVEVANAVRLPRTVLPPAAAGRAVILFVGTMNYLPNEDAACFFCGEILPLIRARLAQRIRVVIAGASPSPAVCALAGLPDVKVAGHVADLAPLYADASMVIAPLRAGGGTRIKILEAFAFRRPVVATTVGAEGILARDGEHLLIRDQPEDFAAACVRLLDAPEEAARLVERADALVRSAYDEDRVIGAIERLTAPAPIA